MYEVEKIGSNSSIAIKYNIAKAILQIKIKINAKISTIKGSRSILPSDVETIF